MYRPSGTHAAWYTDEKLRKAAFVFPKIQSKITIVKYYWDVPISEYLIRKRIMASTE